MHGRTDFLHRIGRDLRQNWTNRMRKSDVRYQTATKKRADPSSGSIEKLIWHEDIERLVLFFEAAHGARREDLFHTQQLEPENVRAKVQLRRHDAVADSMARQK